MVPVNSWQNKSGTPNLFRHAWGAQWVAEGGVAGDAGDANARCGWVAGGAKGGGPNGGLGVGKEKNGGYMVEKANSLVPDPLATLHEAQRGAARGGPPLAASMPPSLFCELPAHPDAFHGARPLAGRLALDAEGAAADGGGRKSHLGPQRNRRGRRGRRRRHSEKQARVAGRGGIDHNPR